MDALDAIKNMLRVRLGKTDTAYLYGSRARGKAREDSDWDILIILDKDKLEQSDYDEISYPLYSIGWDVDQITSPIMYTKKEWLKYSFTPFCKNVEHDKIIIA